jgi:hypothetical protein
LQGAQAILDRLEVLTRKARYVLKAVPATIA